MGDITIDEIYRIALYLIGLGGASITITKSVKSAINKAFEPINKKIDKVDLEATKNYLVSKLDEIDRGQKLEGVSRERFFEQYAHYKELGGNSYISKEIERLEREKLL